MKCFVCGCEFPDDKKFCPGCGRIITQRDREKSTKTNTYNNSRKNTGAGYQRPTAPETHSASTAGRSTVYRPAASSSNRQSDIKSIFNGDPDAPEYSDPHSYDRATADALEYDRMYMQQSKDFPQYSNNKNNYEPEYDTRHYSSSEPKYNPANYNDYEPEDEYSSQEPQYDIYQEDYGSDENIFDEDYYPAERQERKTVKASSKNEKRNAKPHFNINVKAVAVTIAVVLGIIICITGIYQIGKQFGIWGEKGSESDSSGEIISEEDSTKEDTSNANNSTQNNQSGSETKNYKTGIYTVKTDAKTIFMYKSETERTVIATIPNGTVIEITEITDDGGSSAEEDENVTINYYGKTTYNSFSGWIDMEDAEYTPDAKISGTTTEPAQNDSDNGNNDSNDSNQNNDENNDTDTQQSPGEYTVTLNGQGNAVNVRSDHSTDGSVITTLPEGTKVTVDEVQSGWGHVVLDEGEGWIYMQYLK